MYFIYTYEKNIYLFMHPGKTCKKGHLRSIAKVDQCQKAGLPNPLPREALPKKALRPVVPGAPHFTGANPQQFVRLCLLQQKPSVS